MPSSIPYDAILALVRYLESDERKHFERRKHEGEDISRHIHHNICTVSDWLETIPNLPSTAERERERTAFLVDAFADAGERVVGDFAEF